MAAEDFFLGYRKVDLAPSEVLLRVALPCTRPHEYVREFKQAHRRDDDIAIVNAGMRVRLAPAAAGARPPGSSWASAHVLDRRGVAPGALGTLHGSWGTASLLPGGWGGGRGACGGLNLQWG